MRDILFTLLMLALVPVCFRRPLIGLLNFSWLAYMRTQDLTWGFARFQRWSFLVAGVTLAGFLASGQLQSFLPRIRCWMMLALTLWVGAAIVNAGAFDKGQVEQYVEYLKVVGVALFTTIVVTKREHLRVLLMVIGLSFGFYGMKIGIAGLLSLGRMVVKQGPGGMLSDNNDFALALCMGVPVLVQLALSEKRPVLRRGLTIVAPMTMFVVLLTHSRGGFLSLLAALGVIVWRSQRRWTGVGLGIVAGLLALLALPDSFFDRLSTIATYQADSSARGRLEAWKVAWAMSVDNPIFGVGLNMFQARYNQYLSGGAPLQTIVAHNAYLQVLAENGFPALMMYLSLFAGTYFSIWRVRREAKMRFRTSWILNYCTMFEASITAFIVGSTFLNRATFDLFYHFVCIVVVFEHLAMREMHEGPGAPLRGADGDRAITPVERRGFDRKPKRPGFARKLAPLWRG